MNHACLAQSEQTLPLVPPPLQPSLRIKGTNLKIESMWDKNISTNKESCPVDLPTHKIIK